MNYESGGVGEAERYALPDMSEGGRRRRWLIYVVVAAAVVLVVGYLALGHSKPADQPFGANDPSSQIPTVTVMQPGSNRSEEHTSELQSLMRISYAVFCLKKKN